MSKLETTYDIFNVLVEGKRVTNEKWSEKEYVYLEDGCLVTEQGTPIDVQLLSRSVNNGAWFVWSEPKKKVKYAPYMFKPGIQHPRLSSGVYEDDDEFKKLVGTQFSWFKRMTALEVEVESNV